MKTIIIKAMLYAIMLASFVACKKEVYPEELQILVIDSFTRKPIPNASVQLMKVWRHPYKMGNNAQKEDWFPSYGRKEMTEMQAGNTDENGRISFSQEHNKYLYIVPGVNAAGYQVPILDTLNKFKKSKTDNAVYEIALLPMIKTTFIFKSRIGGSNADSVVFSSCDKVKVMYGAQIDDSLVVYSNNYYGESYAHVWYGGTIYQKGQKQTLCNYVVSEPNKYNKFSIKVDF